MHAYRKLIIIKYWLKLLTMNEKNIIYKVYIMLKIDADTSLSYNGNNWAYDIKNDIKSTRIDISMGKSVKHVY